MSLNPDGKYPRATLAVHAIVLVLNEIHLFFFEKINLYSVSLALEMVCGKGVRGIFIIHIKLTVFWPLPICVCVYDVYKLGGQSRHLGYLGFYGGGNFQSITWKLNAIML